MLVKVDPERCEANAICVRLAPAVFHLDDDDNITVLVEEPPGELFDAVKQAVLQCPKQAITVVD